MRAKRPKSASRSVVEASFPAAPGINHARRDLQRPRHGERCDASTTFDASSRLGTRARAPSRAMLVLLSGADDVQPTPTTPAASRPASGAAATPPQRPTKHMATNATACQHAA